MAFLKRIWWVFLLFLPCVAEACPACLTTGKAGSVSQRLVMTGIMGLFPILVAAAIGFKIYQICQSHPPKMKKR